MSAAFVFKCHLSLLIVAVVAVGFAGCGHNESVAEWMQTIPMATVQNDEFAVQKTFKILHRQLFFLRFPEPLHRLSD